MIKEKPLLVIIEGGQGAGKTTTTNYLRENIPSTNLLRLSGTKESSALMSFRYHREVLDMIRRMGELGVDNNVVFDRSFITEWCYTKLGYKGEQLNLFDGYGITLSYLLEELTKWYNVIVVHLMLEEEEDYEHRLKRDKATYECAPFDAKRSMAQQEQYIGLINELRYRAPSVKVLSVDSNLISLEEIKNMILGGIK